MEGRREGRGKEEREKGERKEREGWRDISLMRGGTIYIYYKGGRGVLC